MCAISVLMDDYRDNFPTRWPDVLPACPLHIPSKDMQNLTQELREFKKLLLHAKDFDEITGQLDCEMDEKISFIKEIADALGVDMDDVFAKRQGVK